MTVTRRVGRDCNHTTIHAESLRKSCLLPPCNCSATGTALVCVCEVSDLHDGGWKAEQVQLLEALALELLDLLTQRLGIHLGRGLPHDRALDVAGKAQNHNVRVRRIAANLQVKRPLQSRRMLQSGPRRGFMKLARPETAFTNSMVQLLCQVVMLILQNLTARCAGQL